MKYHTIDLNGEEINLRLTSADAVQLEKKTNTKLLDLISDYSMGTICLLLRYFRRGGGVPNFSEQDSYKFYDDLADNDYAIEDIQTKIILPTLQVSGLLTKSDLENILKKAKSVKIQQATQEQ